MWIKNNTAGTKTWVGQNVTAAAYHEIDSLEVTQWANDSTLLVDISNSDAIMAKDDSGTTDITDVNIAINYLKGNLPTQVVSKSDIQGALSNGDVYIICSDSIGTTSVSEKIHMALKNTDTDKPIVIKQIVVSTTEDGLVTITKNPEMAAGTTLTSTNTNFNSSNTSNELTYKDPTGTNGDSIEHHEISARFPYRITYSDAMCLGLNDKIGVGFKGVTGSEDIRISIHFYYKG